MNTPLSVGIVGAGIAGMTTALTLARAGFDVTLVDPLSLAALQSPERDSRTTALAECAVQALRRMGVWEAVNPHTQPILDIRVADKGSHQWVHYDHRLVGTPLGYMVENHDLLRVLAEAVMQHPNITCRMDTRVTGLESHPQHSILRFQDGTEAPFPLVIGADGKGSRVRELAGIACTRHAYTQSAVVCNVTHEQPHQGLAVEYFLPTGPFAILPLLPGNRSSIVWSEQTEEATHLAQCEEAEFMAHLRHRFGDFLGEVRLEGSRALYPLGVQVARSLHGPRVALVGDAAHLIHPISGQGINLGFRDITRLVECLTQQARLGGDIGAEALLASYSRDRQADIWSLVGITDGLNRLFSNSHPLLTTARRLGLGAVEPLTPLKKLFMRHAMGVLGKDAA
jgi:2-octaprenyl-6-methoxyphenol hydroxylase